MSDPLSLPDLTVLTIPELAALHEALTAAGRFYLHFVNQPRAERKALFGLFEDEAERAFSFANAIVGELRRRRPTTGSDADVRADLLVQVAAECGDWAVAAMEAWYASTGHAIWLGVAP